MFIKNGAWQTHGQIRILDIFECDGGFFICEGEVGKEHQGENFRVWTERPELCWERQVRRFVIKPT